MSRSERYRKRILNNLRRHKGNGVALQSHVRIPRSGAICGGRQGRSIKDRLVCGVCVITVVL